MYKVDSNYSNLDYRNEHKVYARVIAIHNLGGEINPIKIAPEGMEPLKIDRIIEVKMAASTKAGGQGIRYICLASSVDGVQSTITLYHDADDWYMEV